MKRTTAITASALTILIAATTGCITRGPVANPQRAWRIEPGVCAYKDGAIAKFKISRADHWRDHMRRVQDPVANIGGPDEEFRFLNPKTWPRWGQALGWVGIVAGAIAIADGEGAFSSGDTQKGQPTGDLVGGEGGGTLSDRSRCQADFRGAVLQGDLNYSCSASDDIP